MVALWFWVQFWSCSEVPLLAVRNTYYLVDGSHSVTTQKCYNAVAMKTTITKSLISTKLKQKQSLFSTCSVHLKLGNKTQTTIKRNCLLQQHKTSNKVDNAVNKVARLHRHFVSLKRKKFMINPTNSFRNKRN